VYKKERIFYRSSYDSIIFYIARAISTETKRKDGLAVEKTRPKLGARLTVGAGGLPGRAHALEAVAGVEADGAGGAGRGRAVVAAADRAHVAAVAVARGAEAQVGALVRQAAVVQQLVHPLVPRAAAAHRARIPSNKQTQLTHTFTIISCFFFFSINQMASYFYYES